MLKIALKPYRRLDVLEMEDSQFSVKVTLPKIRKLLSGAELYLLVGSDMVDLLSSDDANKQWPENKLLLQNLTLVASVRGELDKQVYERKLHKLQPEGVLIISSYPHASSSDVRSAVRRGKDHQALLGSLKRYISENWLYASVEADPNNS